MIQRGRQGEGADLVDQSRPAPPVRLSGLAAEEWSAVVAAMPGGYFTRETWPLLEIMCRSLALWTRYTTAADLVWAESKDGKGVDFETLEQYQKLADKEAKTVGLMSTKLRLNQQANVPQGRKRPAGEGLPPWLQQPQPPEGTQ